MNPLNTIEIWAPRFHDRKVLIKPFQIQPGLNRIIFSKTVMPNLLISDKTIYECPMEPHGKTGVYAVPLHLFSKERDNQLTLLEES